VAYTSIVAVAALAPRGKLRHTIPAVPKGALRREPMLLNDVPGDKKLAYLLGFQVERHTFGKSARPWTIGVGLTMAAGLLLLLLWLWR
jgi:hypothetical protein